MATRSYWIIVNYHNTKIVDRLFESYDEAHDVLRQLEENGTSVFARVVPYDDETDEIL